MFILHSSNRTENLVAHLSTVIESSPLSSPFAQEVFLVQSQGMERWLSQQLAENFKVWANFQFLFPNKFFSSMAQKMDSRLSDSVFERNKMLWRIEALLRQIPGHDFANQFSGSKANDFFPLKNYLSGENMALKRYQLARQLTQIFDQYQLLRPDMLEQWQHNRTVYDSKTERWQKALWLEIIKDSGYKHRGSLWLDAINILNTAKEGTFSDLIPERISVFGLNTMPPLFLSYLQGLSLYCQVHLFLLNPAQTFWADLASKRQLDHEDSVAGHPLLSILGQQGREFQEMLLEQANFDFEPESFESIPAANNLQQLQNDILNNRLEAFVLEKDGSISIHSCHSRKREVEVLKNILLQTLEQEEELELRDIVVMAPDIQRYEPFVSAIFNDIQHSISDRSLRLSNSALDAFLRFLNLGQSRFGWRSVLDLLEQSDIFPAFGLVESDLELIRYWIQDTQVRWGKSPEHITELKLPEFSANTWQSMLDRLLMGYAVSSDEEFIAEVLPYKAIEGYSASALGGLSSFMQLLFDASDEFKQGFTLKTWSTKLQSYAARLLSLSDTKAGQQLNELLAELAEAHDIASTKGQQHIVELPVIIAWLEDSVSERKSDKGFLRGQLTFCSMLPMRSIPFKVIALLGMNEGEFPKIDRAATFDLLAQHFRKGDRSRRADDRYQFLEILLSARRKLIMTYIGQSISHNDDIQPSVVICELLEVLRDSYQLSGLITKHPLQPFSARYFNGSPGLFSFSESDLEIARKLSTPIPPPMCWWQGELSAEINSNPDIETVIEINDLFNFFQNPQRYFLRKQLGVYLDGIEAEPEEREPFAIAGLDSYFIQQEWIQALLDGDASSFSVKKLQAQGLWLSGTPGEIEFFRQRQDIESFVDRIKEKNLGEPLIQPSVDLKIDRYRLVGKLNNCYKNGSLFYRYANLKGKDFIIALLHHLIANHLSEQSTYLISSDDDLLMLPNHCHPSYLTGLIEIYLQGQKKPDAFFVEAALVYLKQAVKNNAGGSTTKPALDAAKEYLSDAIEKNYNPELGKLYGNYSEPGQVLDESFEQYCLSLLLPVWGSTHSV